MIDKQAVLEFVSQARNATPLLSEEIRQRIKPLIEDLAREPDNEANARARLLSIRAICEGAAGNVAASGIISLIAALLGA